MEADGGVVVSGLATQSISLGQQLDASIRCQALVDGFLIIVGCIAIPIAVSAEPFSVGVLLRIHNADHPAGFTIEFQHCPTVRWFVAVRIVAEQASTAIIRFVVATNGHYGVSGKTGRRTQVGDGREG